MGTATRNRLLDQALDHLRLLSGDVDEVGGAASDHLRLNRTDLRALTLLNESTDGLTAGELARALHVTSGATTRVIDNLAERGHVRREPDARDRRRILVRVTPEAERAFGATVGRLYQDLRTVLEKYREDELETLVRFLTDTRRALRGHSRRLSRPEP